ncbi:MAG TPA: TetR/AcrR family transcriptional regulator [Syntrophales bacterium]|nr:TetR/AcrR family transcriptional regulator [Syntrophales bacterium]
MRVDKKQKRRKAVEALTRRAILDAAIGVLVHDGIQGLTMDRVAAEAGVAKGTLYVYFTNKDDILEAALEASFDPVIQELTLLLSGDDPPDRKLEAFSLCNLRFFNKHRELIRVLMYDRERMRSDRNHFTDSRYRNTIKHVAAVLDKGVQQSLFAPLESEKVAAMFVEANMGMVMQRIYDGISGDVERDARQITDIFINGLRNRK